MTRSNSYPCFLLVVGLTKLDGVPTGVRRSNHTVLLFLCDRVLRLACDDDLAGLFGLEVTAQMDSICEISWRLMAGVLSCALCSKRPTLEIPKFRSIGVQHIRFTSIRSRCCEIDPVVIVGSCQLCRMKMTLGHNVLLGRGR
ncbi:hypothetical protein TWF594_008143 [Orbilia oligospora]|nr:hypothetical protein TWF706_000727 [Orbilia oligospora]KAF3150923.1 hypothetical protein TWF594_008143 [Orbilia oligospora]